MTSVAVASPSFCHKSFAEWLPFTTGYVGIINTPVAMELELEKPWFQGLRSELQREASLGGKQKGLAL